MFESHNLDRYDSSFEENYPEISSEYKKEIRDLEQYLEASCINACNNIRCDGSLHISVMILAEMNLKDKLLEEDQRITMLEQLVSDGDAKIKIHSDNFKTDLFKHEEETADKIRNTEYSITRDAALQIISTIGNKYLSKVNTHCRDVHSSFNEIINKSSTPYRPKSSRRHSMMIIPDQKKKCIIS